MKRFFAAGIAAVRRRSAARAPADRGRRRCRGAPLARVGRAIRPSEREIAANPRARSATLRVAERTTHPMPAGLRRRRPRTLTTAMVRLNLLLLARARRLRAVARHVAPPGAQALRRARARAGARRAATRPSSDSCSSSSRRGRCPRASRRSRASSSGCSCPGRGRVEVVRRRGSAMTGASAALKRAAPAPALPRFRAPIVFGAAAAALRRARRPLALSAVDRQRVPAGAGQRALQPRDRGAGASRPHRRSRRRAARDLDAGQVDLGVSGAGRRDAGASSRSSRGARDDAAGARAEARRRQTTSSSSRSRCRRRSPSASRRSRSRAARAERIPALLPGRRDDEPHPGLHRRPRRRAGRHRARAAGMARRQARAAAA